MAENFPNLGKKTSIQIQEVLRIANKMLPGFPWWLSGKESACQCRKHGLIPRLGRSPGEGIGYPFQYSWAFLVAQMVKNLPAV